MPGPASSGKERTFHKKDLKVTRVRFRSWEFFVPNKINLHYKYDLDSSKYLHFSAPSYGGMPQWSFLE